MLHLVAHFVADVGIGTFVRGSAVSAFCDGHVVDILSVNVRCDSCANGCSVPFSPVGLLWARHPGEDTNEALLSLLRPPLGIPSPQSQLSEGCRRSIGTFRLTVAGLSSTVCLRWRPGGIPWPPCPSRGLRGTGVGHCSGAASPTCSLRVDRRAPSLELSLSMRLGPLAGRGRKCYVKCGVSTQLGEYS